MHLCGIPCHQTANMSVMDAKSLRHYSETISATEPEVRRAWKSANQTSQLEHMRHSLNIIRGWSLSNASFSKPTSHTNEQRYDTVILLAIIGNAYNGNGVGRCDKLQWGLAHSQLRLRLTLNDHFWVQLSRLSPFSWFTTRLSSDSAAAITTNLLQPTQAAS